MLIYVTEKKIKFNKNEHLPHFYDIRNNLYFII